MVVDSHFKMSKSSKDIFFYEQKLVFGDYTNMGVRACVRACVRAARRSQERERWCLTADVIVPARPNSVIEF